MSRHRKTPAQIASELERAASRRSADLLSRKDPSLWGVDVSAFGLTSNTDVMVRSDLDLKNTRQVYARRVPWFDRVLGVGTAYHTATNRLMMMIAVRTGTDGKPETVGPGSGSVEGLTDRMITAGKICDWVLAKVGAVDRLLLVELISPTVAGVVQAATEANPYRYDGPDVWRATVVRVTSEQNNNAQAARVRSAAANLSGAWDEFDGMGRTRREELGLSFKSRAEQDAH